MTYWFVVYTFQKLPAYKPPQIEYTTLEEHPALWLTNLRIFKNDTNEVYHLVNFWEIPKDVYEAIDRATEVP